MPEIKLRNVKVYYEKYELPKENKKPPILLIHGFLSSTHSFRKIIPLLREHYSVFSLDLPGFGKSEKALNFTYSYHNYGTLIIDFIKKMNLAKVILIGHSMGGQISLYAAKQAPNLIDKLILLGSSAYLRRARRLAVYFSYFPCFPWFIKKWFEKQDVKKKFLTVVYQPSMIYEESIQGYLEPFKDKLFFESMVRLLRQREGDLSSQELKQIETPSLLIWGREDRTVPLHIGEKLVTDLPNAKLVVYEETGHLIPEEKPNELIQEIIQFV